MGTPEGNDRADELQNLTLQQLVSRQQTFLDEKSRVDKELSTIKEELDKRAEKFLAVLSAKIPQDLNGMGFRGGFDERMGVGIHQYLQNGKMLIWFSCTWPDGADVYDDQHRLKQEIIDLRQNWFNSLDLELLYFSNEDSSFVTHFCASLDKVEEMISA